MMIVGIDEVGRGAWAGPLVVGAVLLGGATIDGLTDSKLLTKKQREALNLEIRQKALAIGIGWVGAQVIDKIGLSAALTLAAERALSHIRCEYREVIIDGTIRLIDDPKVTTMKKADLLIPSVSAAAIVAKVARDNYMRYMDIVFPGYRFANHVGYGTAAHRDIIKKKGVSPIHRVSYLPLQQYDTTGRVVLSEAAKLRRTTKQIGDAAEAEAAIFLEKEGHQILSRNWRTKFCEIDIVSRHGDTIYFTEVKYRKTDKQGGGLGALTAKKQRQMKFAAEYYSTKHGLSEVSLRLAAANVSGTPPTVVDFLKLG